MNRPESAPPAPAAAGASAPVGRPGEERAALIRERMQALAPVALELLDEAHLHAGHAGARGGAGHFRMRIVSPRFAGLGRVARHRLVYDRLADLMPAQIHALAVQALTPEEDSAPTP